MAGKGDVMWQEVLMLEKEDHLFERLARERNITVEEMRAIISARIEKGCNDPDLEKRTQWRKIPCVDDIPTPDEWLRYVVERLEVNDLKIFLDITSSNT